MIRTWGVRYYAQHIRRKIVKDANNALVHQERWRVRLTSESKNTVVGRKHHMSEIYDYDSFRSAIPLIDYEGMRPHIESIIQGESDVLWPGTPKYFAKTSGTTSGVKYIPISKESMPYQLSSAQYAVLNYIALTGNDTILNGNLIFLSGSPELEEKGNIPTGRLSGIVNHEVPSWLRRNQLPNYTINCVENWEDKLDQIVDQTITKDMRLISGIPPWVQMYYELLLERSGAPNIKTLFPNFKLFVQGGVNYAPYKSSINALMGESVDTLETYPASEGFIAFQDQLEATDLLLNTNAGIFFEFIPVESYFDDNPQRLSLHQVETGVNYAIIISTNAGLWAYKIGDTIEFTSIDPFRIRVTGRVAHFISAFGEHVISQEVDRAITDLQSHIDVKVTEFTVAPQITPSSGLPYHEWFIEGEIPANLTEMAATFLDESMRSQNIYYDDLRKSNILRKLVIKPLPNGSFKRYMESIGKLGGQNKLPRLRNDRKIVDALRG